jgi:hypothetical protein
MDRADLLTAFTNKVDEFERYQTFINKAKSQSTKFATAVVEKVIKDNTEKSTKVVEEIIPLVGDIEDVVSTLAADKQKILDGRQTSQFALEELELRLAIGEMDEKSFEDEAASLKEAIGSIDSRAEAVEGELSKFRSVMERWTTLGNSSGFLSPKKEEKKPEPKAAKAEPAPPSSSKKAPPVVEEIEEVEAEVAVADEELDVSGFEEERPEARIEKTKIAEDLSDILGESEPAAPAQAAQQVEANEIDILGDDNEVEVEAGAADEAPATEESRRAVLLYQEATPEEQIYPFNNDELTLGRGRDNDIQVKNDSKVSRYHCKLYRRGPNFYIEDNKSANGTLVNGELITERRLFGGEEIIIGETFFRFRIMD